MATEPYDPTEPARMIQAKLDEYFEKGRAAERAHTQAVAEAYMAERNNLEQDDMPTFTVLTIPMFLKRLDEDRT